MQLTNKLKLSMVNENDIYILNISLGNTQNFDGILLIYGSELSNGFIAL